MAEGHGRFIDIGVNLDHRRFSDDRDAVVERARQAGVATMVLTGTSLAGSERALDLANRYELFSTAGVHPHDASSFESEGGATRLKAMLGEERVVAVGECGLDFDRDFSPRPIQEKVFAEQIQLASDAGLPLFLHERSAHSRLCTILDAHPGHPPAVVHCFTGTQAELCAYLKRDLYIGITGWICDERRGTHLLEFVREIPAGRLMIETDAPFLTPRSLKPKPKKGRNEPAFLPHIAATIARARGETLEELAAHTRLATETLFRPPIEH